MGCLQVMMRVYDVIAAAKDGQAVCHMNIASHKALWQKDRPFGAPICQEAPY